MGRNNKGYQRAKSPKHMPKGSRTFRTTFMQEELLKTNNSLLGQTFTKFNSDLIDQYFVAKDFMDKYDLSRVSGVDKASFVGNGVDTEDATRCLLAWILHQELNDIKILPHSLYFFEKVADPDSAYGDKLIWLKLLVNAKDIYFHDLRLRFVFFCAMNDYIATTRPKEGPSIKGFHNCYVDSERLRLDYMMGLSPALRFATFFCRRYGLFDTPSQQPEWYTEAPKDVLRMLDHSWRV